MLLLSGQNLTIILLEHRLAGEPGKLHMNASKQKKLIAVRVEADSNAPI
jgi:hypothetical protein